MWADDIMLFSYSEEGLQCMLDKLFKYTQDNGMKINADKTKVMIFNKTGRFYKRTFRVEKSKYLPLMSTSTWFF